MKVNVKDNVLTIEIALDGERTESKSGKSLNIATTGGNQPLAIFGVTGENAKIRLGLNMYVPK